MLSKHPDNANNFYKSITLKENNQIQTEQNAKWHNFHLKLVTHKWIFTEVINVKKKLINAFQVDITTKYMIYTLT